MEAGWYLKTADAPEAHWWDGTQYTTHTSPLTGYPFAVHPDPLAAPVAAAPPAPPAAPEPVAEPVVDAAPAAAAEPEVAVEPPVEVAEELPVIDEPVVDAAPVVDVPPVVEPPFSPPPLTAPEPRFGPPEPAVPVTQSFGPPQVSQVGPPQPTYGAPQAAPYLPPANGAPGAERKGMNKGLLWGIIGGGALVLIIIIVLIANLLSSVFASNPITAPVAPPVATSEPGEPAAPGDPVELPEDSNSTGAREVDEGTKEIFASLVISSIPTLANETQSSIVDGGLAVCEMFDESSTPTEVADVLTQSGLSITEAGLFLGYSVALLCPEYTDVVGG